MAVIGIDLGTTNSLGCVFRDGRAELIPNRFGSCLTPSVVSVLEDGTVLVGQPAKERRITHPDTTFFSFKRDMGTDKKFEAAGKSFSPEDLSALVISSIIEDAKNYLGEEIEEAVISVPAYFHDRQRVATKRAGRLAGVKVERILNEPSAAALANYEQGEDISCFLVFDFGGGTLDVSLVECIDTIIEIHAVAGDNHLGGDDFNELIADSFLSENRLKKEKLSLQAYSALMKKAEECKIALSSQDEATLHLTVNGKVYESTFGMQRLMKEGGALLMRIRDVIARVLKDGRIRAKEIQKVVMVGGSSKMPLVQSYVRHLFHQKPEVTGNCDEMVALGLGMFCGIKERKDEVEQFVLSDICPFSLGTEVLNHTDPKRPLMSVIIARNSTLPCSRERGYMTSVDMQSELRGTILQGEHAYADENIRLGDFEVPLTPLPKGEEKIQIRYSYDINGILMVDIKVKSTGNSYSKVLSEKLSEEELEQRKKELEQLKADPFQIPENQQLIEKLKSLYEEVSPEQKEVVLLLLNNFGQVLQNGSPVRIRKIRKEIEEQLARFEVWDPFMDRDEFEDVIVRLFDSTGNSGDDWDDPFEEMPEGWNDIDNHPGGYLS